MGWDSSTKWKTKKDVVQDVVDGLMRKHRVLAFKAVKSGVWSVLGAADGSSFIAFDLIEKQGGRWYVKGMAEDEHPYYYDCPKEFLELSPTVRNAEWRARVLDVR